MDTRASEGDTEQEILRKIQCKRCREVYLSTKIEEEKAIIKFCIEKSIQETR